MTSERVDEVAGGSRVDGPVVLVATDGTETAIAAAARAREVFPEETRWDVVCVVPEPLDPAGGQTGFAAPVMTPDEVYRHNDQELIAAHAALAATARAIGPIPIHESVRRGDTAEGIIEQAGAISAAAIVVGTDTAGRSRHLASTTVDRLLRDAPCPVLVVPSRAATTQQES
jgi:nucleotide-binding universal stress UspA family protein